MFCDTAFFCRGIEQSDLVICMTGWGITPSGWCFDMVRMIKN